MRTNPFGVGVHSGCGMDGDGFFEVGFAAGRESGRTSDVVLFSFEDAPRDEHWEVGVLDTELLGVRVGPIFMLMSTTNKELMTA